MIKLILLLFIYLVGFPLLLWLHNKEEKRCYRTAAEIQDTSSSHGLHRR